MSARDVVQELAELGPWRSVYRVGRELYLRSGAATLPRRIPSHPAPDRDFLAALPFGDPREVVESLHPALDAPTRARILADADDALLGRVVCFGRWRGDYGAPVDWYRNPRTGARWPERTHWSRALIADPALGDVKLAWEPARFPQAFALARAAALDPTRAGAWFRGFVEMVHSFIAATPFPWGIHWASSQESAIRLAAWLFAAGTFARLGHRDPALERAITGRARLCGHHLRDEIGYARHAVYNNHLLSEALGLCLCAWLCPDDPAASGWHALGMSLLDESCRAQFFSDGGYINQSHNYHRTVVQELLFASRWHRSAHGADEPRRWRDALERSLDFLSAQQNPSDGRLPNYGANDGSMPRPLSSCDFSDFRPCLQTLSLHLHGERLYAAGPWDEEAAWTLGPSALDAPTRAPRLVDRSFGVAGLHVLRADDPSSFATFRCGSVRERFGQIDMLHVDLWWRGENVLVDGGTWFYGDSEEWYAHFLRTASHNTVTVDGRDQMLHHRRFKFLYWTRAELLRCARGPSWSLAVGEHSGYARHPGGVIHRRSVLRAGEALWVIADTLAGAGRHDARLHWLCGPYDARREGAAVALATPRGELTVSVFDEHGAPCELDLAEGAELPPRGWLSRYFGERVGVPSIVCASTNTSLPWTRVTVVSPHAPSLQVEGPRWTIENGPAPWRFELDGGIVRLQEEE